MPAPHNNLLALLFALALLAIPASLWGNAIWWWTLLSTLSLVAIIDLVLALLLKPPKISRQVNQSLPLAVSTKVSVNLSNDGNRPIQVELFDHVPANMKFRSLPTTVQIPAAVTASVNYYIYPEKRGEFQFQRIQLKRTSVFKLWKITHKLSLENSCRVYPDFAAVSQYALLAMDNRLGQLGINKHRRRGEGQEFHQLREYRQGDPLQKIDWKATSKHRKLISREYNDERNQEILLVIDCGHRMRTMDGELSHFDHSLNAALLLSYVALQQGDSVGISTFSGENRWIKPSRGQAALKRLLNGVYDLQPGTFSPDYSQTARSILVQQKKRALIIFITNVRDEDSDDLRNALILLQKRHLVLVASMREQALTKALESQIESFQDAIRVSATQEYLHRRTTAFNQIKAANALSLDVNPDQLSVQLVNNYLKIKSSGAL